MSVIGLALPLLFVLSHLDSGLCFSFWTDEITEESVTEVFETTPAPTALEVLLELDPRVKRQAVPTSQATRFKKLMHLIEAGKLMDCAGRVVCDLNCDPNAFGSDGKRVLSTLTRLQTSGHIERQDMDFYVRAGVAGRKGSSRKDCHQVCRKSYPVCPADSKDLVSVASLIKLRL